jgi:hypothetical protein
MRGKETAMEAAEALMADQLDAIIQRLTKRIEADAERPRRKGCSIKALKKRLRQIRDIRSHFNEVN